MGGNSEGFGVVMIGMETPGMNGGEEALSIGEEGYSARPVLSSDCARGLDEILAAD
jgi:hypothetical protein